MVSLAGPYNFASFALKKIGLESIVEEDTKGKRVAYKEMHTLYEAEQKRADRLSQGTRPRGDRANE
jgi:hypothetical protein